MAFKTYNQRVIEERDELDDRLKRLRVFLTTDLYKSLSREDREYLYTQSIHMDNYLATLVRRIGRFNG